MDCFFKAREMIPRSIIVSRNKMIEYGDSTKKLKNYYLIDIRITSRTAVSLEEKTWFTYQNLAEDILGT